jgi:hypothetical protein
MNRLLRLLFLSSVLTLICSHAHAAPKEWESPLEPETGVELEPSVIASEIPAEALAQVTNNPLFNEAVKGKVQVLTFRKPKDFSYEFSVLAVEGRIERVFLVSTAMAGKIPILGIHRLTPLKVKCLPWPWIRSSKYEDSPMYWGINIRGGFYIHSTPHYGNLGRPASMGCVRASLPDAMEVFNTVANLYASYSSYSMIYEGFSSTGTNPENTFFNLLLKNSHMTMDDVRAALITSKHEIAAVSTHDLHYAPGIPADAHARPCTGQQSEERLFPTCGGSNCWDVFKKIPAIVQLRSSALMFL